MFFCHFIRQGMYCLVHASRDLHHLLIEKCFPIFPCRPVLLQTGIFEQLRVDMGNEWVLILFIQEILSGYRNNQNRPSHIKTTSKRNLMIERVWPEVNSRINYPIKRVLAELEEKGMLDISNANIQFCVSWFTCEIAKVGMKRFVDSWNHHRIKGNIPNTWREESCEVSCEVTVLFSSQKRYTSIGGGTGHVSTLNFLGMKTCLNNKMERKKRIKSKTPSN